MRIAELAKPGIVVVAVATGAVVAFTWPAERAEPPRPIGHCDEVRKPIVAPPVASDLERYLSNLPLPDITPSVAFPRATFHTSLGTVHCALFPQVAPLAVANFVGLAS